MLLGTLGVTLLRIYKQIKELNNRKYFPPEPLTNFELIKFC